MRTVLRHVSRARLVVRLRLLTHAALLRTARTRTQPQHQNHQHWGTNKGGHNTHLKLTRHHQNATQNIGGKYQHRAVHQRQRQHARNVGTHQQTHHMRHDQAHKTNRARNRSRRTTQRHDRNNRRATHHCHRYTQASCRILAECQGTQRTDQHEREHQTQCHKGQRRQHLLKGAVLQRTHHPETVRIKSLRIKHCDNAGNRAQAGVHRHTRQHQTRRRIQVRLRIHQAHDEHQRRRQTRTQ